MNDIKNKIQVLKNQKSINKENAEQNKNLDIEINKDLLKKFKKGKKFNT